MAAGAMELAERSESRRGAGRCAPFAGRCALLLAVCALLASLAALATVLVDRAQEPPRELQPTPLLAGCKKDCTHLVFGVSEGSTHIKDRKLSWWKCGVEGTICSPIFEYHSSGLGIKYDGLYSIYAQMNISHQLPQIREEVNISLTIHGHRDGHSFDILTLPLSHPATAHTKETAVTVFKAVSNNQLKENDKLSVKLMASKKYTSWTLSPQGNFFGVSQIHKELISEVTGIKCCS